MRRAYTFQSQITLILPSKFNTAAPFSVRAINRINSAANCCLDINNRKRIILTGLRCIWESSGNEIQHGKAYILSVLTKRARFYLLWINRYSV